MLLIGALRSGPPGFQARQGESDSWALLFVLLEDFFAVSFETAFRAGVGSRLVAKRQDGSRVAEF